MSTEMSPDRGDTTTPPTRTSLRLPMLGAATAWISLFVVVYLAAEWVCSESPPTDLFLGFDWLSVAVLALSATTLAGIVAVTRQVWRTQPDPEVRLIAAVLGGVFVVSTIVLAVPALVVEPC